jgi:hypothetical protein
MRFQHRVVVVALCCAALAWIAGPAGRLLVAMPLLLFGPGYLFERAWPAFDGAPLALRPALWLGLSISLIALIYEWATALGLVLAAPVLYALAAACGAGVIWRYLRTEDRRSKIEDRGLNTGDLRSTIFDYRFEIALLVILTLILWTRFSQIEGLALPPWVDSVHHALMIRIAAESGQAPISLRPYLPVDQLPYHWGYHVLMAAIVQLTGLGLSQVMLWVGQVLNLLQALAAAALAAYLWRRPLAGVVAALVVGLLSIMPAYYLSWGRYTQLTGLLILPPLMIVWRELLRAPSRGRMASLAVLLAGLSLVHFRVLVFALAYLAVSGAIWLFTVGESGQSLRLGLRLSLVRPRGLPNSSSEAARVRAGLGYAALAAALALALAAPWLWLLMLRTLLPAFERPSDLVANEGYSALTDGLLWAGHNRALLPLALAAALWGLARRSRAAAEQVLWVAVIALLANPTLLGLPHIWLITNDVLVISLFLPAAVLIGGGACWLVESLERRWVGRSQWLVVRGQAGGEDGLRTTDGRPRSRQMLLHASVLFLLAGLALRGAWELRSVVNPDTILATEADVAAIAWAAEHTPVDARFLINATPWQRIYRGTDGGWWLLPLAGRWVSTPPVLFAYGPPENVRETRAVSQMVAGFHEGQEQQINQLIERERISYIYLGKRAGPLSLKTFANNPAYTKVYERDGVTILAVNH